MDADDARRMLLLVPKFIELPPHSRAVEALSLKGAFQENFPYLFPQNDVSLAGNNLDFLGVCEVEGPIEASSNDPREAFGNRSEEHTSELQSLMRISYAVFSLQKKNNNSLDSTLPLDQVLTRIENNKP